MVAVVAMVVAVVAMVGASMAMLMVVPQAPSGMMGRGAYAVTSVFTDDDKTEHLRCCTSTSTCTCTCYSTPTCTSTSMSTPTSTCTFYSTYRWEWNLEIRKDWA